MSYGESTSAEIEATGKDAVDAAFRVHSKLGPGLLESSYEICLAYELRRRGHTVETQVPMPVVYDGVRLDAGYRFDLLVDKRVIVEMKAVDRLIPVFEAGPDVPPLSRLPLAFLINFNVVLFKDGIKRLVLKTAARSASDSDERNPS